MCGSKCGAGSSDPPKECGRRNVYDGGKGSPASGTTLPQSATTLGGQPNGIECMCFYVPSPGFEPQKTQAANKFAQESSPVTEGDLYKGYGQNKSGPSRLTYGLPQTNSRTQDICDETYAIPYPRPAPSVELRGGQIYSGCHCVKRDGLQHDCPRTGCQGKPPCLAYPAPQCVPSGNAPLPTSEGEGVDSDRRRPRGGRRDRAGQGQEQRRWGGPTEYRPPGDDDPYVRRGRQGYREHPPVERGPRVPCREHRKPRR